MSEESKEAKRNREGKGGADEGGIPAKARPAAEVGESFGPESQRDRWVKYGSNVALSVVVVVLLASLVIWLTQSTNLHMGKKRFSFRKSFDVTSDSSLSLKPQTASVISDLKEPIKLVSLYPKLKRDEANTKQDFYTPVLDLLEQYRQKGHNIEVEAIDPVNEPAKLDHWIGELKDKYGSNTKSYHDLLSGDVPKTLDQLNKLASAEVDTMKDALRKIPEGGFKSEEQVVPFNAAYATVAGFPKILDEVSKGAQEELEKKFPDYKLFTGTLKSRLNTFSSLCGRLHTNFDKVKDDKELPEPARKYAADSIPRFDQMKKLADELVEKINKLGELKLDEVRRKLFGGEEGEAPPPAIAVMGPSGIKLIDFNDVWKSGETTRMASGPSAGPPKLRFAGEQQVTSAVVALSETKKQKICFVRAGGEARLVSGFMRGGGDLSDIGDRLKGYNFDVTEKDVAKDPSQPPQSQMPTPPEPSMEDIKDAIWIVLSEPSQNSQFGPMPPSPELGNKLKQHLDEGGSAVCLIAWRGDGLSTALKEWGIDAKPDAVAVHEPIEAAGGESDDMIEQARRQPPIFVLNEYGDSPVTTPLTALDSVLVPLCVVQPSPGTKVADVTVTSIIPVPQDPKSWGETDTARLGDPEAPPPKFDPAADIAQPIYGGAIAEKKGKGRLVVLGCSQFINNYFLRMPDLKIAKQQKVNVARFPGNGELLTDSVFWCARQERMIALSPSALDTARIEPIKPGLLNFWRVGVVLFALPLLAIASGFVVYQTRRA